ncbi:MAG: neutral/alkaline non-lysosomal ceramidase N-terminal domain-containing protein [Chloroflexota bacterium]
MSLKAGAAKIDITPPTGLPMAGMPILNVAAIGAPPDTSGYFGREGLSTGTHDPLYARALVLGDGSQVVAIVALDLLVVEKPFTDAIREAIQIATGIPPAHVLLAPSHTHSGPDIFDWDPQVPTDQTIRQAVQDGIVEAVTEAYYQRRPARIGWSDGHLERISINRRDPAGPIDPRVGVMWVEGEDERPIALTVNFAIHTITLSAKNLEYTAELSGFAMTALERTYPEAVALFLNGAAGNINPVAYPWEPKQNLIPVFRKAWHAGEPHPRTFRNAMRLGRVLAGTALQTVEQVEKLHTEINLAGAIRNVALPLRPTEEIEIFRNFMGLSARFGAGRLDGRTYETEVQALTIGPKQFIGLPGEPFIELALDLQHRLGRDDTYVIGFANDDPRYILPKAEYQDNRYETWGSIMVAGCGEILVDAAEQVAKDTK